MSKYRKIKKRIKALCKVKYESMTNGDYIRQKFANGTNKELADMLFGDPCDMCAYHFKGRCAVFNEETNNDCKDGCIEWLNQKRKGKKMRLIDADVLIKNTKTE